MEFWTLLRLVVVLNLILILFRPLNIQEREPDLCDFIKKQQQQQQQTFNIGLHSNILRPISFKFGVIIQTNKLYILILV